MILKRNAMYGSRLVALLDGYLESRSVSRFNDLRALILYDRIKAVLPEPALRLFCLLNQRRKKAG